MSIINKELLNDAKAYIGNLFGKKLSKNYTYHNLKHTLEVYKDAEIIGENSKLADTDFNTLKMSALFHDVGYIDSMDEHELFSAFRAAKFLCENNVDELIIRQVFNAILATKIPQQPKDLIAKILCDADLMYLSMQTDYFYNAELLRQEGIRLNRANFDKIDFHKNSLIFFNSHRYHSEYGKIILQPLKDKTELLIKNKVENMISGVLK